MSFLRARQKFRPGNYPTNTLRTPRATHPSTCGLRRSCRGGKRSGCHDLFDVGFSLWNCCNLLKDLWYVKKTRRILRSPPGELNFKCLAFRPHSPSPVRHPSLKTCEMWCFRSGLSPGLSFLCLLISGGFLLEMFVCVRVVSTCLIISF